MSTNIERWHPRANIGIRKMVFDAAGDSTELHFHNFAHTLYCTRGSLLAEVTEGGPLLRQVLKPGDSVVIEAERKHRVTALIEGSQGDCIFAHRTPQGEVVQEYTGWDEAHLNRSDAPTPAILAALASGEDTHGVDHG